MYPFYLDTWIFLPNGCSVIRDNIVFPLFMLFIRIIQHVLYLCVLELLYDFRL